MKTMKSIFSLIFACSLLLWSCDTQNKQETEMDNAADKEVMAVHDRAMSKLEEINKLKSDLNDNMESVRQSDLSDEEKEKVLGEMEEAQQDLDDARNEMMEWMREYNQEKAEVKNKSEEERRQYYEQEQDQIEKIDNDLDRAIEDAKNGIEREWGEFKQEVEEVTDDIEEEMDQEK